MGSQILGWGQGHPSPGYHVYLRELEFNLARGQGPVIAFFLSQNGGLSPSHSPLQALRDPWMKAELSQYLPQPPSHCCLMWSGCSGHRESQGGGCNGGGRGGHCEPGWKGGKPREAGPPVPGAGLGVHLAARWQQAPFHQPWAGGRERNYCKWERQVSLVGRGFGLGRHVSEDDSSEPDGFPQPGPHLYRQLRLPPERPAFPSVYRVAPMGRIPCVHLVVRVMVVPGWNSHAIPTAKATPRGCQPGPRER